MLITFLSYNLLLLFTLLLPAGKLINSKNSGLIRYETDKFRWNARLAIILLYIVLIAGTREAQLGTDFYSYLRYYNYILTHGDIGSYFKEKEIGWEYLNLSFGKFSVSPEVFFGLVSGMTWFFFIKGSYRFQFLLPLMFFFVITNGLFIWTLNGLRQSIAIMIFFYAIRFIIEKDLLRYTFWISIASLFHTSALILLPFYFITKIKFNQNLFMLLYIISIFLAGNNWFMTQLSNIIMLISYKVDLLSSYANYIDTDTFRPDDERTRSGLGVLLRTLTTIYIIYKSKYILKKQPKLEVYYIFFIIGAILANIFSSVEIIGRVLLYFHALFPIVIASTIYYSTDKYQRIVNILIIVAYFIVFQKSLLSLL